MIQNKTTRTLLYVLMSLLIIGVLAGGGYYAYIIFFKPANNTEETKEPETKDAVVQITKEGFMPATILVSPNTTITWTNEDESPHRVASDPYPDNDGLAGFDSIDELQKGDTYSFTFTNEGEFGYHDQANPLEVKGTVIVKK